MNSSRNFTNTILLDTEIYTGRYEKIEGYFQSINVLCNPSHSCELKVYHSSDSVNDDYIDTFACSSGQNYFNISSKGSFFKVQLTNNSGSDMTSLRLSTSLSKYPEVFNLDTSSSISVSNASHDDFNVNSNLQVGDADVDVGNPVPIDGNVSLSSDVASATHDNFNCNANIQISDSDLIFGQALMAQSLPVVLASNQTAVPISATGLDVRALTNSDIVSSEQTVRPYGNTTVWSAEASGTSGSTSVDCQNGSLVSCFGNVGASCVLKLQVSSDNTNWFDSGTSFTAGSSSDFHMNLSTASRYVRVISTVDVTATAHISFKA